MKRSLAAVLIVLALGSSFAKIALASGAPSPGGVAEVRQELESKLQAIARRVDPESLVIVNLRTASNDTVSLPGTPLVLGSLNVAVSKGEARIENGEARILSSLPQWPAPATQLLSEIGTTRIGAAFKVRFEKLPAELVSPKDRADAQPSLSFGQVKSELEALQGRVGLFSIIFACIITGGIAGVGWVLSKSAARLQQALDLGVRALAQAKNEDAESSSDSRPGRAAVDSTAAPTLGAPGAFGSSAGDRELSLNDREGLAALLSDCYWTSNDSYGSFLWRKIPRDLKSSILQSNPLLLEYGYYLSKNAAQLGERDLAQDRHPAYLTPLPIGHLDAAALTRLVNKQPKLYSRLSSLRQQSLALNALERWELESAKATAAAVPAIPAPFAQEKSAPRTLQACISIPVASIDEDERLIQAGKPAPDKARAIVTLAWAKFVDDAALSQVLEEFSARDLATAWSAPRLVLDRMKSAMPEKKAMLVEAYSLKRAPNRDGDAYRRLHLRIAGFMQPQHTEARDSEAKDAA